MRRLACSTTILGSVFESPSTISTLRPSTPPAALISSTASSKPALWALPYTVQAPVSGEIRPTLIGASARAERKMAGAANETPVRPAPSSIFLRTDRLLHAVAVKFGCVFTVLLLYQYRWGRVDAQQCTFSKSPATPAM